VSFHYAENAVDSRIVRLRTSRQLLCASIRAPRYCGRGNGSLFNSWETVLSRIWDAIKEAEQHRATGATRGGPEPAQKSGRTSLEYSHQTAVEKFLEKSRSERRSSKRRVHRVALLVYGSDSDKQPFHEEAYTLEVNDNGCMLSLESVVLPGQRLFLINPRNMEHECRVIRVGRRVHGKARVVVEFRSPFPRFWNAFGAY